MQFSEFLSKTSIRNAWVEFPGIEVYLRKQTKVFNGRTYSALVLANIRTKQGKRGYAGKFLKAFEEAAAQGPFEVCFVENVFSPVFKGMLERRGYQPIAEGEPLLPCFFKQPVA